MGNKTLFFLIFLLLQISITSSTKLFRKDLLQLFGDFLEPDSAQKMKETTKQWSNVKIYENIFPNESEVAVFRKLNTEEIQIYVSHLCRNDSTKWNDVFLWFAENRHKLNKSTNKVFLKAVMLTIAENVDVTLTDRHGISPLMLAAAFDDKDSIVVLIKRGANVNQQDNFEGTICNIV